MKNNKKFKLCFILFIIFILAFLVSYVQGQNIKSKNVKSKTIKTSTVKKTPVRTPRPSPKPSPTSIQIPTPIQTPTTIPSPVSTPIPLPTNNNPCVEDGVCKANTICPVQTVKALTGNTSSRVGECGHDPSNECVCESYPISECDPTNCSGKSCMAIIFGRPYNGMCNYNGDICSCLPEAQK